MYFSSEGVVLATVLALGVFAGPLTIRDEGNNKDNGLPLICDHLKTQDRGCIRYVRGFDITGVTNEVDLTFPQIKTKCDCIQECLNRPDTCANWVYKFSTSASVLSGHRTCTLYSNFNLPKIVSIFIDISSDLTQNIGLLTPSNNPQIGNLVPQAFKDVNLDTVPDDEAFSGAVWQLSTGQATC